MKRKGFFKPVIVFFVSTFLPFLSFAQQTSETDSKTETSALLYQISGKNLSGPSYLFGTIHIVCPKDMFPMKKIIPYYSNTERLILELDMDNPIVTQKMLTAFELPNGKTLQDYLSPEKYAKIDEIFKKTLGISVGTFKNMNPMGLAVVLGSSSKSIGCPLPASYEAIFVDLAINNKIPVEGLETVEEQIAALNKIPLEKQAEDLYKFALEPQKAINQFKDLVTIYKLQDAEKLTEFTIKETSDNPDFQRNLLNERNKIWIPKIEKAITEKPSFIAVGGAHLGGENGVVKLLREQGFTLTPIRF